MGSNTSYSLGITDEFGPGGKLENKTWEDRVLKLVETVKLVDPSEKQLDDLAKDLSKLKATYVQEPNREILQLLWAETYLSHLKSMCMNQAIIEADKVVAHFESLFTKQTTL